MYKQNEYCEKLGLRHGQFFAHYRYKNLWWFLNGVKIGFGDLRDEDIQRIQDTLIANEEFVGFHEMYDENDIPNVAMRLRIPRVVIGSGGVKHAKELYEEARTKK